MEISIYKSSVYFRNTCVTGYRDCFKGWGRYQALLFGRCLPVLTVWPISRNFIPIVASRCILASRRLIWNSLPNLNNYFCVSSLVLISQKLGLAATVEAQDERKGDVENVNERRNERGTWESMDLFLVQSFILLLKMAERCCEVKSEERKKTTEMRAKE